MDQIYRNLIGLDVYVIGTKEKGEIIEIYENDIETVFVVSTKNNGVMNLNIDQIKVLDNCIREKKEQLVSKIKKLQDQKRILEMFQEIHV
ncbi:hypothetical protein AAGG74_16525 [Bacillus mexicanus]|uniref:hypothetical protein n=1 Tax=Bacillus mexicanus TaxID=2834415 RepID=UPI003D1E2749